MRWSHSIIFPFRNQLCFEFGNAHDKAFQNATHRFNVVVCMRFALTSLPATVHWCCIHIITAIWYLCKPKNLPFLNATNQTMRDVARKDKNSGLLDKRKMKVNWKWCIIWIMCIVVDLTHSTDEHFFLSIRFHAAPLHSSWSILFISCEIRKTLAKWQFSNPKTGSKCDRHSKGYFDHYQHTSNGR